MNLGGTQIFSPCHQLSEKPGLTVTGFFPMLCGQQGIEEAPDTLTILPIQPQESFSFFFFFTLHTLCRPPSGIGRIQSCYLVLCLYWKIISYFSSTDIQTLDNTPLDPRSTSHTGSLLLMPSGLSYLLFPHPTPHEMENGNSVALVLAREFLPEACAF